MTPHTVQILGLIFGLEKCETLEKSRFLRKDKTVISVENPEIF